jgi:hypothetical protein
LLESLECRCNQITSIDVSHNTELINLSVADNRLTTIDVFHNTKLKALRLGTNHLSSLDVSNNPLLEWIDVDNNELTSFDMSNNPKLNGLVIAVNHIATLDISGTELTLGAIQVGGQTNNQGNDIILDLYVNPTQYNNGELVFEGNDYYRNNENVNIILNSDATHEGYNENNYGG